MVRFLLFYVVLAFAIGPELGLLGPRDTAVRWIATAGILLAAAIAAIIVERRPLRPPNQNPAAEAAAAPLLRLALRLSLGITMLVHGAGQLVPTALPEPALPLLTRHLGALTREELVVTFLGASQSYQVFNGALEVAAGLFLLFPATTLLGAVMTAGLVGMQLVLVLCYDVSTKLVTIQALVLALLILAPHGRRLVRGLLGLDADPVDEPRHRLLPVIGVSVLAVCLAVGAVRYPRVHPPRPPLYGIWSVDLDTAQGDAAAWRYVLVDRGGRVSVADFTGNIQPMPLTLVVTGPHDAVVRAPNFEAKLSRNPLFRPWFHWFTPPEDLE